MKPVILTLMLLALVGCAASPINQPATPPSEMTASAAPDTAPPAVSPDHPDAKFVGVNVPLPCPAHNTLGQWRIEFPQEVQVLRDLAGTEDFSAFVDGMAAIHPRLGEEAKNYLDTCWPKTI